MQEITIENIGKILLDYRIEKEKTQADIAKKTNLSLPTISDVESGSVKPQFKTFYKLKKYLETVI